MLGMLFVISKIVYTLLAPSSFSLVIIGAGLLAGLSSRLRYWSRRLIVGGFLLLLVFGFSPAGKLISRPLEDRFAGVAPPPAEAVTHIIVLGGAEQANIARARQRLGINASGERILEIPALARRYPKAKIVFTGGHGWFLGDPVSGAADVANYFVSTGIQRGRILLESRSQNTWQNGLYVKDLLAREKTTCPCGYLVVTSAWHMPRSVGIFRKLGFDGKTQKLYVWPVDYRTEGTSRDWRLFRWLHEGLRQSDLGVKEWIGLIAYRILGRTSEFWPAPRQPTSRP